MVVQITTERLRELIAQAVREATADLRAAPASAPVSGRTLGPQDVCGLLGIARSTLSQRVQRGAVPRAITPPGDRRPLWSAEELAAWMDNGCPHTDEWTATWRRIRAERRAS